MLAPRCCYFCLLCFRGLFFPQHFALPTVNSTGSLSAKQVTSKASSRTISVCRVESAIIMSNQRWQTEDCLRIQFPALGSLGRGSPARRRRPCRGEMTSYIARGSKLRGNHSTQLGPRPQVAEEAALRRNNRNLPAAQKKANDKHAGELWLSFRSVIGFANWRAASTLWLDSKPINLNSIS